MISIVLFRWKSEQDAPVKLIECFNLSQFSFFTRSTVAEFVQFGSRLTVGRTNPGSCRSTKVSGDESKKYASPPSNSFLFHSLVSNIEPHFGGCVVVTSSATAEYPNRVVFQILRNHLSEMQQFYENRNVLQESNPWKSSNDWTTAEQTDDVRKLISSIQQNLNSQYQSPQEMDKLNQVQRQLDDIKETMHQNIEQVLKRGESLDDLMQISQDLSNSSLIFYRQAKKQNSCCKMY